MNKKESNDLDVSDSVELEDSESNEIDDNEQFLDELTEASSDDSKLDEKPKTLIKVVIRLVAILTALVFLMTTLSDIFSDLNINSIKFLANSIELSREPKIRDWKKSVAMVSSEVGSGTGFNISAQGVVVTNNHVVKGASKIFINFPIKFGYKASKWDSFPDVDLAIIKLENNSQLPFLNLETEIAPEIDDKVTVIGNPVRFFNIVSEGKVMGYTKIADWDTPILMIQAPIYKGNSGSPVINARGNVIGIIFATKDYSKQDEKEIVGLAIPTKEILLRIK